MTVYKIHPAIGVCRVGNCPDEFFIGPERPGERPNPPGGFKDSKCRVKRQAARFRIFAHDTNDPSAEPLDVTETFVDIRWTVRVGKINPRADVTGSVRGRLGRTALPTFGPHASDPTLQVPLGEIRTDDLGRLIVLGGFGASDYELWYDDLCDGPVQATFWRAGEDPTSDPGHAVTSAWVVVAPPRFAPHFDHPVTAYDIIYDNAAQSVGFVPPPGAYSTAVSFGEHIYPLLQRAHNLRWISGVVASAGVHSWIDPNAAVPNAWLQVAANRRAIVAKLSVPFGAVAPPGLPPAIADMPLGVVFTFTQYQWMAAFAGNGFLVPDSFTPPAPGAVTAHGLDRAGLDTCCGGPYADGMDITSDITRPGFFLADDRFRWAGTTPGSLTYFGTPWNIDIVACTTDWPVVAPSNVIQPDGTQVTWSRRPPGLNPNWRLFGFIVPQGDRFVETERCDETLTVTLLTPGLDFGVVRKGPGGTEGQALRAIVFEVVSSGTAVSFAYDAPPAAPFASDGALPAPVGSTGGVTQTVRLWVRYVTPTSDDPALHPTHDAVVNITASNGQHFRVTLHAETGQRVASAIALVLDRSGSMDDLVDSTHTKHDELVIAAKDFLDLALDGDYIQLVRYDDTAQCVPDGDAGEPDITATATGGVVSASALTRLDSDVADPGHSTRGVLKNLIGGGAFAPNRATSIGAGIAKARPRLAPSVLPVDPLSGLSATPAVVILTDGLENTAPFITDVASSIDAHTYAIGLGPPELTSAAALQALSGNHGGYMLITGDLASGSDDAFLLEKYFLQILASINKAEVVLDPQGTLRPGDTHVFPCDVTEIDGGLEAIVVTPFPHLIDFRLIAPNGRVIDPARAQTMPEARYTVGSRVAFYRVSLPALIQPRRAAHAGRWHAMLKLATASDGAGSFSRWDGRRPPLSYNDGLPYSLLVNSYSALSLRASLRPTGFEPGATLNLDAVLLDAGVRPVRPGRIWAEVSFPDGTAHELAFHRSSEQEHYSAALVTRDPGTYRFRVRAEGQSAKQHRFTRERTLTAAVWYGGDREPPRSGCCNGSEQEPDALELARLRELA